MSLGFICFLTNSTVEKIKKDTAERIQVGKINQLVFKLEPTSSDVCNRISYFAVDTL